MGEPRKLDLPDFERVRYERNTIHQAFCELRFPTLPEITSTPPREFVKGIRKKFPHYEEGVGLKLGVTEQGMQQVAQHHHRYLSTDRNWTTWIKAASLGLETKEYLDFDDFLARLMHVLEAAKPCLDTDFFTRIGLRYINIFPVGQDELSGWIHDSLIGPLNTGVLGTVGHYWCETRGETEVGGYTLRYGIASVEGAGERFIFDTDFFGEAIDWGDAAEQLRHFNSLNFRLYSWALGAKAREFLGKGVPRR